MKVWKNCDKPDAVYHLMDLNQDEMNFLKRLLKSFIDSFDPCYSSEMKLATEMERLISSPNWNLANVPFVSKEVADRSAKDLIQESDLKACVAKMEEALKVVQGRVENQERNLAGFFTDIKRLENEVHRTCCNGTAHRYIEELKDRIEKIEKMKKHGWNPLKGSGI